MATTLCSPLALVTSRNRVISLRAQRIGNVRIGSVSMRSSVALVITNSEPRKNEIEEEDEEENVDLLTEADFEDVEEEERVEEIDEEEEEEEEKPSDSKSRRKRRKGREIEGPQVPDDLLPRVAIVGRPNVGKSALFNRLVGKKAAIVHDEAGVTRDRLYGRVCRESENEEDFMLVDTGGVMTIPGLTSQEAEVDGVALTYAGGSVTVAQHRKEAIKAGLPTMIEQQAASAVEEAAAIIFVVDGQAGATAADIDIAAWLRRKYSHKNITLAVNKCESPKRGLLQAAEFWSLGFEPLPVSAISRTGIRELLSNVCSYLQSKQEELKRIDTTDRPLAVAIIGKPNVGKSSILNALAGEERTIVSPVSGTTRDAIDTDVKGPDGKVYRLIDTAGIRRRSAIAAGGSTTESLCVNRALKAIRRSDVVALVIDAMACVTEQDFRLGDRIVKDGKGCIIVVNKWDTVPEKNGRSTYLYEQDVREKLRMLWWAPIVYTSAVNRQRIHKILETAIRVGKERERRITTSIINQVSQDSVNMRQPPSTRGGKKGRVYFATQAAIRPPTFVFFVNDAELFPDDYRRYMEKQLRKNIGFPGTPIRLLWRSKKKFNDADVAKSSSSSKYAKSEPTTIATLA